MVFFLHNNSIEVRLILHITQKLFINMFCFYTYREVVITLTLSEKADYKVNNVMWSNPVFNAKPGHHVD